MIEIALSACLLTSTPTKCQDFTLSFTVESGENGMITPFKCMRYAQPEIQKWSEMHPKWKIEKWKCLENNKNRAKA